ncbi:hypothetical protein ACA910_002429 [Epithemia clementina (nom. ined.)]
MKISTLFSLLLIAPTNAFVPAAVRTFATRVSMSDEPEVASAPAPSKAPVGGALVPIKEETVEFTAGLVSGAAGLILGGPVLGAIAAAAGNYISKSEGDVAVVVKSVAKASIEVFNYLAALDSKYEALGKAKNSLDDALTKLKSQPNVDPETLTKVEKAISSTKKKVSEINDEYDLVGGGMTALGVIGDLVEKAVQKVGELNKEYKLSDKAVVSLKGAVEKAKEAAENVKK